MGKSKKFFVVLLVASLFMINFSVLAQANKTDYQNLIDSFEDNGGKIVTTEDNKQYATDYVIYSDKNKELILFCKDGKLQRFLDGDIKVLQESFNGNILIYIEDDKINRAIQSSSDKCKIIFYGNEGSTYLYDFIKDNVIYLPMSYANIIWSEDGNSFKFITSQDPYRSGMGQITVVSRGLYYVNSDGTFKELIDSGKEVIFKSRESDGVHFVVVSDIASPVYEPLTNNINEMLYDNKQGILKYCKYIPDGYKAITYNNINSYNSAIAQLPSRSSLFINGNYVLTNYNDGYARYDLKTYKKKIINKPIGIYKGYYYYYSIPGNMGKIKKMDIATLSKVETLRAYAESSYAYIKGNELYYYNPQHDTKFGYKSVPYCENLDTHKLSKLTTLNFADNNYYIFKLNNGNKVCYYFSRDNKIIGRLEDEYGKFICDVGQYYNGYFYSVEKTSDNLYPMIVKIDIDGNKHNLVQIANKHAYIGSLTINGGKLYFISDAGNWNLYSCNLDGTNLIKY